MSADFKNVLYTQDAVLDYHGYHTVELTKPVEVSDFAVVVTYEKGAPVEGESIENGEGMYKTVSEKGQSFVFAGGTWKDLSDADAKTVLKTDFAPGNACIKALFVK
jgi:putative intracellular protease/amidase